MKFVQVKPPVLESKTPLSEDTSLSQPSLKVNSVNYKKLKKRLRRNVGQAIDDFNMIENGDKVMVCLSGGKDSYTMLDILLGLKENAPIDFTIRAVNMDQGQPGFPKHILPEYLEKLGVDYDVIDRDTYTLVTDVVAEGKSMCGLCSRLRRGTLYGYAEKHGFTKIALGHHRDDMIETLFLNMFFGGSLKSMPPKLKSDDGKNIVIRPLAYAKEKDIEKFSQIAGHPIIPCNLCGSQENLQRQNIKQMVNQWEAEYPGRSDSIFKALQTVAPSQLADRRLFNFADL